VKGRPTIDSARGCRAVTPRQCSDGSGALALKPLTLQQKLEQRAPNRWDGPSRFGLSELTVTGPENIPVLGIGSLDIATQVEGLDLERYGKLTRAASALGQPGAMAAETPAHVREQIDLLQDLIGGARIEMRAGGVALQDPDSNTRIAITDIGTGFSIAGLRDGLARIGLTYRHGGFALTPNPAGSDFTPEAVELSLEITDLPNAGLWQAVTGYLDSAADLEDGSDKEAAQMQAGARMVDLLTKARSSLKIDRLLFRTPVLDGTLRGSARLDGKAVNSAVGEADIVLRGLDGAVKLLSAGPKSSETDQALGVLSMLQMFGQIAKDDVGREIRTYAFKVQPDGKVLLNGADMTMMLGAAGKQ